VILGCDPWVKAVAGEKNAATRLDIDVLRHTDEQWVVTTEWVTGSLLTLNSPSQNASRLWDFSTALSDRTPIVH
jgi:hypothetical protein